VLAVIDECESFYFLPASIETANVPFTLSAGSNAVGRLRNAIDSACAKDSGICLDAGEQRENSRATQNAPGLKIEFRASRQDGDHQDYRSGAGRILTVGLQRVRAHQFRKIRRLMSRRRPHRTHLEQFHIQPAPRTLPRGLGPSQPRPDNFDACHLLFA